MEDVQNLAETVTYQEKAIVSKTLINKPVGTLTVFAFAEGQGLSEHTASYDAFVNILEGEVKININGEIHDLKSGDFVIMPAGIPHSLTAVTRFKMLLTMIKD